MEEPWSLLTTASSLARRLQRVEQYIKGGLITDVLDKVGDVHFKVAIDHLRLAGTSNDPYQHVQLAAHELITAYRFFDDVAQSGPSLTARRMFTVNSLRNAREKAAGSAGLAALLATHLGETPEHRRALLDRVAKHVSANWLDNRARDDNKLYAALRGDTSGPGISSAPFSAYFELEESLLPPEFIRERPLNWRPHGVVLETVGGQQQYNALDRAGYFDAPEHNLLPHGDA